jgi:adenine phosphoribosyltransferase
LVADDLLATGGTISATLELIQQLGGDPVGAAFFVELGYLGGRDKLKGLDIISLVRYD